MPVTPFVGLASRAPYTLALHGNVWLSARRVTEAHEVDDFLTLHSSYEGDDLSFFCAGRTH